MPLLNRLLDEMAHVALLSLHIPVLAGVFWWIAFSSPRLRHWSQLDFDAFLIGHGGVYWLMSGHMLTMFASLEGAHLWRSRCRRFSSRVDFAKPADVRRPVSRVLCPCG